MFTMSRTDWRRLWMHVPGGLFGGLLLVIPSLIDLGILFNFGFFVYEVCQDWRIGDKGFKDILGHVVGLGIIGGIFLILELIKMF